MQPAKACSVSAIASSRLPPSATHPGRSGNEAWQRSTIDSDLLKKRNVGCHEGDRLSVGALRFALLSAEEVLVKVAAIALVKLPAYCHHSPIRKNFQSAGGRDGFVSSGRLRHIRGGRDLCARFLFDAITFASRFAMIDIESGQLSYFREFTSARSMELIMSPWSTNDLRRNRQVSRASRDFLIANATIAATNKTKVAGRPSTASPTA